MTTMLSLASSALSLALVYFAMGFIHRSVLDWSRDRKARKQAAAEAAYEWGPNAPPPIPADYGR